jgi:hypothetical protein
VVGEVGELASESSGVSGVGLVGDLRGMRFLSSGERLDLAGLLVDAGVTLLRFVALLDRRPLLLEFKGVASDAGRPLEGLSDMFWRGGRDALCTRGFLRVTS